jgi:hypothetical protein
MVVRSRRIRWAKVCSIHGRDEKVHKMLVRGPGGKRKLERPRNRMDGNKKMGLKEIRYNVTDWFSDGFL